MNRDQSSGLAIYTVPEVSSFSPILLIYKIIRNNKVTSTAQSDGQYSNSQNLFNVFLNKYLKNY